MPLAVAVMRLIGRTPSRTTQNVTSARIATIAPVAASSTRTSREIASSTSSRVVATTSAASLFPARCASTW